MGFHTFYHFGASVNNKTTVGFGTLADVDFGLRRFSSGDYDANMALGFELQEKAKYIDDLMKKLNM